VRPVWKGALTFGLVTIPVGLYPATARGDLSFRLLHAKDTSPIAYRRVCAEENVEVPWAEIVIAAPTGLELPADAGLDRREIDLALQVVGTLEGPWQPEKYRDRYRDALQATIERKLEGRAAAPAERGRRAPTKVVDLMSALEASLKAQPRRDGARAAGRREGAAPRKPAARRRAS
jgi:non-homologous end joining protein Ku